RRLPGRRRAAARLPRNPGWIPEARRGTLGRLRDRAQALRARSGRRCRRQARRAGRTARARVKAIVDGDVSERGRIERVEAWLASARAWADRELDASLPAATEPPARLSEAV